MAFLASTHHLIAYHDSEETSLPVLFLAHPLGMSRNVWDNVCDQLHGYYRCIRWDLPGHGSSGEAIENISILDMANDVLEIADELNIAQFSFIGTSIGGVIGQSLCQIAPNRLKKMWLTNTGSVIGTKSKWYARSNSVRALGLEDMAKEIVPTWFSAATVKRNPELIAGWIIQLSRCDNESYAKLCEALSDVDNTHKLKEYLKPIILIGGTDDVSTPPSILEKLKHEFTSAELVMLKKVGHVPSIEAPKKLVHLIKNNSMLSNIGKV